MQEGRRSGGSAQPDGQGSVQPQHAAQETAKCTFLGLSKSENREVKDFRRKSEDAPRKAVSTQNRFSDSKRKQGRYLARKVEARRLCRAYRQGEVWNTATQPDDIG